MCKASTGESPQTETNAPRVVDTVEGLVALMEHLVTQPVVAVDTESDSFHHYFEKVCLIQISSLEGDWIVDPLALGDHTRLLAPIFEREDIEIVLHDAGYDVICLRRDYDFTVRHVFDTMLASRLLGERRFGLAAILEARFGVECDKRYQRSDWSHRPLTDSQLRYARRDTHYLLELRDQLLDELRQRGRLEMAHEEFGRLCERPLPERNDDPDAFFRLKSARQLGPRGLGVLRDLHRLRDETARRLDQPVFKVLSNEALCSLAERRPTQMGALLRVRGVTRRVVSRLGPDLLAVIRDAAPETRQVPPTTRRRRPGRSLHPKARKIFDELRLWRAEEADRWDIEPEVLVSNASLEIIAIDVPADVAALQRIEEFSGWRAEGLAPSLMRHLQEQGLLRA